MSLVNAVHELIEVAAGRRNLSGVAADELHAAIDAEQAPALPDPPASSPEPGFVPSGLPSGDPASFSTAGPAGPTTENTSWQS